jgi:hypothetical protein
MPAGYRVLNMGDQNSLSKPSLEIAEVGPPRGVWVVGPEGFLLSLTGLPRLGTKRWVARRKAEVVAAVRGGLLGIKEACQRYGLSEEEFHGWERGATEGGMEGLMVTKRVRRLGNNQRPSQ